MMQFNFKPQSFMSMRGAYVPLSRVDDTGSVASPEVFLQDDFQSTSISVKPAPKNQGLKDQGLLDPTTTLTKPSEKDLPEKNTWIHALCAAGTSVTAGLATSCLQKNPIITACIGSATAVGSFVGFAIYRSTRKDKTTNTQPLLLLAQENNAGRCNRFTHWFLRNFRPAWHTIMDHDSKKLAISLAWTRQQWQQQHLLDGSFSAAMPNLFLVHQNFSVTLKACWRAMEDKDQTTYVTLLSCLNQNNLTFLQADLDILVTKTHVSSAVAQELCWFFKHSLNWCPKANYRHNNLNLQVDALRLFLKKKLLLVHPDKFKGVTESQALQANELALYENQRVGRRVKALYDLVGSMRQLTQNRQLMTYFFEHPVAHNFLRQPATEDLAC